VFTSTLLPLDWLWSCQRDSLLPSAPDSLINAVLWEVVRVKSDGCTSLYKRVLVTATAMALTITIMVWVTTQQGFSVRLF
jgi:hypothetical protein